MLILGAERMLPRRSMEASWDCGMEASWDCGMEAILGKAF